MDTRVLDTDVGAGITRLFHYDPDTERFHIETVQDVSELVETNRANHNNVDERAGWKGNLHRVASIPLSVYMDLKKRGIVDDDAAFKRWLNDRDNLAFRTRPGRV